MREKWVSASPLVVLGGWNFGFAGCRSGSVAVQTFAGFAGAPSCEMFVARNKLERPVRALASLREFLFADVLANAVGADATLRDTRFEAIDVIPRERAGFIDLAERRRITNADCFQHRQFLRRVWRRRVRRFRRVRLRSRWRPAGAAAHRLRKRSRHCRANLFLRWARRSG